MILQKQQKGSRLGEILIQVGTINEEDFAIALGTQLSVPFASLQSGLLKPKQEPATWVGSGLGLLFKPIFHPWRTFMELLPGESNPPANAPPPATPPDKVPPP